VFAVFGILIVILAGIVVSDANKGAESVPTSAAPERQPAQPQVAELTPAERQELSRFAEDLVFAVNKLSAIESGIEVGVNYPTFQGLVMEAMVAYECLSPPLNCGQSAKRAYEYVGMSVEDFKLAAQSWGSAINNGSTIGEWARDESLKRAVREAEDAKSAIRRLSRLGNK